MSFPIRIRSFPSVRDGHVVVDRYTTPARSGTPDLSGFAAAARSAAQMEYGGWRVHAGKGRVIPNWYMRAAEAEAVLVTVDPTGRTVVWTAEAGSLEPSLREIGRVCIPSSGAMWAREAAPHIRERAWDVVRRSHARALLAASTATPKEAWMLLESNYELADELVVLWLGGAEPEATAQLATELVMAAFGGTEGTTDRRFDGGRL